MDINNKLEAVLTWIESLEGTSDVSIVFPLLDQEQTMVETMRTVFYNVIKTH